MIAQDKYMNVYTAKQTKRLLGYIVGRPSPKIKMAKESLTKQAYNIVFEEYSKKPLEDSSTAEHTVEDDAEY